MNFPLGPQTSELLVNCCLMRAEGGTQLPQVSLYSVSPHRLISIVALQPIEGSLTRCGEEVRPIVDNAILGAGGTHPLLPPLSRATG
jgi:hypothetical protein